MLKNVAHQKREAALKNEAGGDENDDLKIKNASSGAQTTWTNGSQEFGFTIKTKRSIRIIKDSE